LWCWLTGPASPGRAHLLQLLAQLGCCGVASSSLSVQWLCCLCAACLCVSLFRSHPLPRRAVKFGLVPKCFVPKFLIEQILYLIICTQWCKWQFICQSLRVLTLILSQFLFVLLCFLCRLYDQDQDQDIGDEIASLDLVFFYDTLCNFFFSLQYYKDIVQVFYINKLTFQFVLFTYSISMFQLNLILSYILLMIIYSNLMIFKIKIRYQKYLNNNIKRS
jgi:hypothetical protein